MILESDTAVRELLRGTHSVAVVGASDEPARPSHGVFTFLRTLPGLEVAAVNPRAPTVAGTPAYASLEAFARERGAPDVVDVFRRSSEAEEVARQAIAVGAKAIWFQYGVASDQAVRLADAAGLDVVTERCIKVEFKALRGSG